MTDPQRRGFWYGSESTTFAERVVPPRPSWFEELVELMVEGTGAEDRVMGVVRAHVEDDDGIDFRYRVFRRGGLYRCESLDGGVQAIGGRDTTWKATEDGSIVSTPRERSVAPPDDYEFGTARPSQARWEGDDFTVPTGPPTTVHFLGREALEVELAPPPHKPFPIQLIIDAGTGLLLRQANEASGVFHEWVTLDTAADLPDALFEFTSADRVARRYS